MRTDKELAFELRRSGKSYKEIAKELGMSKSTLTVWFKGHVFSEEIRKSLTINASTESTARLQNLNKIRGDSLDALYHRAMIEATLELEMNKNNPLFIAAISAYWGEGDKRSRNNVRLINTDPLMLRLFIKFLVRFCSVTRENIKAAIFIYPDLDEETCRQYWEKEIGISSFHKTMVLPSRHKTKKLQYGTCSVIVSNTYLKKKMLLWIDQLPKIVLNTVSK
ncbi:MAG: helix-turn-helix domain-containing protein [Patescibacteria group bacterium]